MASFFDKLKKGMGVEIPEKELEFEEKPRKESKLPGRQEPKQVPERKVQKLKIKTKLAKSEEEIEEPEKPEIEEEPETEEKPKENKIKPKKLSVFPSIAKAVEDKKATESKEKWFEPEGQLAIDVYQTDTEIVIRSTIAGAKPEDLDISIEADNILIKGNREEPPEAGQKNYFYQECFWGPFSRQIILPEEADPNRAEASMKEGVLIIRIPKIERKKKRKIIIKG